MPMKDWGVGEWLSHNILLPCMYSIVDMILIMGLVYLIIIVLEGIKSYGNNKH